jgi:hypothetical protein
MLWPVVQLHKLLAQLSSTAAATGSSDAAASASSGGRQVKRGYLSQLLCSSNWTQTVAALTSGGLT